jgi:hypothetical protein
VIKNAQQMRNKYIEKSNRQIFILGGAGILLIEASVINGTVDNLDGRMFCAHQL